MTKNHAILSINNSGDNSFKIKDLVYENDLQQGIAYEYDHSGKIITIMEYNKGILKSKM